VTGPWNPSFGRTLADDLRDNPRKVDGREHVHFHEHGGRRHSHAHAHPGDAHAPSSLTFLPPHRGPSDDR
jgi:hypothetical protein